MKPVVDSTNREAQGMWDITNEYNKRVGGKLCRRMAHEQVTESAWQLIHGDSQYAEPAQRREQDEQQQSLP